MRAQRGTKPGRSASRLPTREFRRVTAEYIHRAVQGVLDGAAIEPFAPSTDFDLVTADGARLPPKAVFGKAASEALGFTVLPRHFTGGLGTPAFAALEKAGYSIVPKEQQPADAGRPPEAQETRLEIPTESVALAPLKNPPWTRDETILLLDLYLRRPASSAADSDVQALSRLLNVSPSAPTPRLATYRNAAGVAMKLRNLANQDPSFLVTGRRGLRGGGAMDATVWKQFAHDRAALDIEVTRIRAEWGAATGAGEPNAPGWQPSRGPAPLFGSVTQTRVDGDTAVYLMILTGPVEAILPRHPAKAGWAVLKVGRSNDVGRRCIELNAGLPPAAVLRWDQLESRIFSSAELADREERRLLNLAASEGWSLGNEFVFAHVETLRRELLSA